jgi:hypothetical protein
MTDQIKKRITRLENENKKLEHALMMPLPYDDLVNGRFSRALDKALTNNNRIAELKRKLDETFTF